MDVFTLFHGSEAIVSKPEIGLCRPYNDYGKGFYCTADQELGKEWACQKGHDGFVSCYELPLDGLVAIDLNGEGFTALHWLSVLFENRLVRLTTPVMERGGRWIISRWIWTAPTSWRVTGRMIPTLGSRAPF